MDDCEGGSCASPDYRRLLIAKDAVEAAVIAARLEGEGVPVVKAGGEGAIAFGGAPADALTVDLWVSADRFEDAIEILNRDSGDGRDGPEGRSGEPSEC